MAGEGKRIGNYEVLRELARGGMGVVYLARHAELGREVALKVMRGGTSDQGLVQRFIAEAQTVAQLDHPNIVRVHEVGREGRDPFLVMDLIEGESLEERLKRQGPLPPREAAEIGRALAEALEHAHERSIVHRDVKPANVLLDREGRPRLTDFGLAKDLSAGEGLTREGQWVGTPGFMPPEQATGDLRRIDRRSDVYALGGTLYALVTGRPPYEAQTAHATLEAIKGGRPTPPSQLQAEVTPDLEAIILKCLEHIPETRYHSARDLAEDLGRFLHERPVLARPLSGRGRLVLWARRNTALAASSLGAALLLGVTGVALLAVFVLPQQRAAEALVAHRAYQDEVLQGYAFGLGGSPAPDPAALEAQLSGLREALEGTSLQPELEGELEFGAATLRVLRGAQDPIPRARAGRSVPDQLADALLLQRRGELVAAERALASARRRVGPYSDLADLIELELLAQSDPGEFFAHGSQAKGAAQQRVRALAPHAAAKLFERQLLALAQGELRGDERRRAEAALQAALGLGLDPRALSAAKTQASAQTAPRWRERLETALEREQEGRLLSSLGAFLREAPAARPAPELDAVLAEGLERLLADFEARPHEEQPLRRVAEYEERLVYDVDGRRRTWRALTRAAFRVSVLSEVPALVLLRFRHGTGFSLHTSTQGRARIFERLAREVPESQIGQLYLWRQAQGRSRGLAGFEAQLKRLEEIVELDCNDLGSRYYVQAIAELSRDSAALEAELALRLQAFAERIAERVSAEDPEELDALVSCWQFSERLDPVVPAPGTERRFAALRQAAQRPEATRERQLLALYTFRSAQSSRGPSDPEQSLAGVKEALALYEAEPAEPREFPERVGAQVRCAVYAAELLRELERPEQAWQVLQATRRLHGRAQRLLDVSPLVLGRLLSTQELTLELARSAQASGRAQEGRAILDTAIQVSTGTTRSRYERLRKELASQD